MLDLDKESFDYSGWHFEFCRDAQEMFQLLVIAKKDDRRIGRKLRVQQPSPFDAYYQLFIGKWMEKAEKQAIEDFKKRLSLTGELESLC